MVLALDVHDVAQWDAICLRLQLDTSSWLGFVTQTSSVPVFAVNGQFVGSVGPPISGDGPGGVWFESQELIPIIATLKRVLMSLGFFILVLNITNLLCFIRFVRIEQHHILSAHDSLRGIVMDYPIS